MEEVIYQYTRADALFDGVLVDLSLWAKEMGIKYPVAVTDTVYHTYLVPAADVSKEQGQDLEGRIWDILSMFRFSIHNGKGGSSSSLKFHCSFVMTKSGKSEIVDFKALCHGGDNREPVITIMMPHED